MKRIRTSESAGLSGLTLIVCAKLLAVFVVDTEEKELLPPLAK